MVTWLLRAGADFCDGELGFPDFHICQVTSLLKENLKHYLVLSW